MTKFNIVDDGYSPELVYRATFSGTLEMPTIEKPDVIQVPEAFIPFTQLLRSNNHREAVHFYEHDFRFADVLFHTKRHLGELSAFPAVISPDCSLYRDMPLCLQIANTYMSRAVGHYLQLQGMYVIPNVRWGDERSYTTIELPERFAFLGIEKHSIVAISTYGCIRGKDNKHYFREGLEAMLDYLEPEVVLVYGAMPDSVFSPFRAKTYFVNYPDWISEKRKKVG